MSVAADTLDYPWPNPPKPGEAWEVAPGVLWARMPLPFRLNHVNIWLIQEEEGWTVIDTGCVTPVARDAWETLLSGPMQGRPITRVIATHGHVDHIGMTGELVRRYDAEFVASFAEWAWSRFNHIHDVPDAIETLHAHLLRNGFDESYAQRLITNRRGFVDLSTPLPGALTALRDRALLCMGGRNWEVIVSGGHSHEHCGFHDPASDVLIVGDQVLPKISPAISVLETMPDADPLSDFLDSFDRFSAVSENALILPSHGSPFRGLHRRITELREHHEIRLDATRELLCEPRTGMELTRLLFPHVEGIEQTGFALGETLAHLNYLRHRQQAEVICDKASARRFQLVS